ncbi:MAG TPA: ABC transporter ATP-binding protein [Bryobacteraceae bacterium]|nr:ABC transporter ATP-binding protein [Bryobacteraceae bacterium]
MNVVCQDVTVRFATRERVVTALRNVSLDVRSGEFLSIVGPSGCGKTTLLRTLAGLIQPQSGVVERIFQPTRRNQPALLVFQDYSLFPWMTVLQNSAFGLEMQGINRSERETRARALLDRLGLAGWEGAYPHQLSAGMRQRVAVIRSFLSNPGLLLMDEPFGALDSLTRRTLQQELLELWEQNHKTVIFVTHDVEEAILLSDRVLVMSRNPGAIVAQFDVALDRPRRPASAWSDEVQVLKRRIYQELGFEAEDARRAARS